jgi:hypothetical protein
VPWDRATRAEARDYALWLARTRKPPRHRRGDSPVPGAVSPVTGKPHPAETYAIATRRHARAGQAGPGRNAGWPVPPRLKAGQVFEVHGEKLQRRNAVAGRIYVTDLAAGRRRDLTFEEERAFRGWATIEILRATGHPRRGTGRALTPQLRRIQDPQHRRDRPDAPDRSALDRHREVAARPLQRAFRVPAAARSRCRFPGTRGRTSCLAGPVDSAGPAGYLIPSLVTAGSGRWLARQTGQSRTADRPRE